MEANLIQENEEYNSLLRDFYAGLAMLALVPMIDSAEAGQRLPSAAFDIANQMMQERSVRYDVNNSCE